MSEHYACEFYLKKYKDEDGKSQYVHKDNSVVSSVKRIWDLMDFSADITWSLDNDDRFYSLEDGIYWVYISGSAWFDSSIDWESEIEEGNFVFEFDVVKIIKETSLDEDDDWFI